jgi:hypothetical protein
VTGKAEIIPIEQISQVFKSEMLEMLREISVWGSQVVYSADYIRRNSVRSGGLPVLTTKQSKRYYSESSSGCSFS